MSTTDQEFARLNIIKDIIAEGLDDEKELNPVVATRIFQYIQFRYPNTNLDRPVAVSLVRHLYRYEMWCQNE